MLAVAAGAFALGIVLSLRSAPHLLSNVDWRAVAVLALMATPATLALNALEFSLSGRLVGQDIPFGRAMGVTIVGSAANLLPLPGATLVRLAALRSGGAGMRSGLTATALLAILALGVGFAYSGVWAMVFGSGPISVAILAIGVIVLSIAWLLARQLFNDVPAVLALIGVRLALVSLDAARTWLAFVAIGYEASFAQASVLTISTVLAAVVAIVPAGLGLREGIAALAAPIVGVAPAAAFLATSLSRIVGLTIVMALTIVSMFRRRSGGEP